MFKQLEPIDFAIVGEPTQMDVAIAEKGLMVIDATAHGKAGHAARDEGENALYKACDDIQRIRDCTFKPVSELLGDVKCTVTQIEAGSQHNVVPDQCRFVIDVRTTDTHSNEDVFNHLDSITESELNARSFRLNSSSMERGHPFVKAAIAHGATPYGSPTTSDQAVYPVPSVKIGPGDSARSHTADEFIHLSEIKEGIDGYIAILDELL